MGWEIICAEADRNVPQGLTSKLVLNHCIKVSKLSCLHIKGEGQARLPATCISPQGLKGLPVQAGQAKPPYSQAGEPPGRKGRRPRPPGFHSRALQTPLLCRSDSQEPSSHVGQVGGAYVDGPSPSPGPSPAQLMT